MRYKKTRGIFALLLIIVCIFATSCGSSDVVPEKNEQSSSIETPEEYSKCLIDYLEALKISPQDSAKYAYFPNETIKAAYENSGVVLLDYSVEEERVVNDSLYAFYLKMEDSYEPGEPYYRWKFVGEINDEVMFIGNVNYIPEELQENLVVADYTVTDEDTLSQDEVLFEI